MRLFRPEPEYIREMKHYGILDAAWREGDPIDVYELDRKYWESFWWRSAGLRDDTTPGPLDFRGTNATP
jgi:hypothetical protein